MAVVMELEVTGWYYSVLCCTSLCSTVLCSVELRTEVKPEKEGHVAAD
jgi:hypothetical protein